MSNEIIVKHRNLNIENTVHIYEDKTYRSYTYKRDIKTGTLPCIGDYLYSEVITDKLIIIGTRGVVITDVIDPEKVEGSYGFDLSDVVVDSISIARSSRYSDTVIVSNVGTYILRTNGNFIPIPIPMVNNQDTGLDISLGHKGENWTLQVQKTVFEISPTGKLLKIEL